jgi:hypothetical protein
VYPFAGGQQSFLDRFRAWDRMSSQRASRTSGWLASGAVQVRQQSLENVYRSAGRADHGEVDGRLRSELGGPPARDFGQIIARAAVSRGLVGADDLELFRFQLLGQLVPG